MTREDHGMLVEVADRLEGAIYHVNRARRVSDRREIVAEVGIAQVQIEQARTLLDTLLQEVPDAR